MVKTQPRDALGRFTRESFTYTSDSKLEFSELPPQNWDIWESRTIQPSSKPPKVPLWAILSLLTVLNLVGAYFAAHLGLYGSL